MQGRLAAFVVGTIGLIESIKFLGETRLSILGIVGASIIILTSISWGTLASFRISIGE